MTTTIPSAQPASTTKAPVIPAASSQSTNTGSATTTVSGGGSSSSQNPASKSLDERFERLVTEVLENYLSGSPEKGKKYEQIFDELIALARESGIPLEGLNLAKMKDFMRKAGDESLGESLRLLSNCVHALSYCFYEGANNTYDCAKKLFTFLVVIHHASCEKHKPIPSAYKISPTLARQNHYIFFSFSNAKVLDAAEYTYLIITAIVSATKLQRLKNNALESCHIMSLSEAKDFIKNFYLSGKCQVAINQILCRFKAEVDHTSATPKGLDLVAKLRKLMQALSLSISTSSSAPASIPSTAATSSTTTVANKLSKPKPKGWGWAAKFRKFMLALCSSRKPKKKEKKQLQRNNPTKAASSSTSSSTTTSPTVPAKSETCSTTSSTITTQTTKIQSPVAVSSGGTVACLTTGTKQPISSMFSVTTATTEAKEVVISTISSPGNSPANSKVKVPSQEGSQGLGLFGGVVVPQDTSSGGSSSGSACVPPSVICSSGVVSGASVTPNTLLPAITPVIFPSLATAGSIICTPTPLGAIVLNTTGVVSGASVTPNTLLPAITPVVPSSATGSIMCTSTASGSSLLPIPDCMIEAICSLRLTAGLPQGANYSEWEKKTIDDANMFFRQKRVPSTTQERVLAYARSVIVEQRDSSLRECCLLINRLGELAKIGVFKSNCDGLIKEIIDKKAKDSKESPYEQIIDYAVMLYGLASLTSAEGIVTSKLDCTKIIAELLRLYLTYQVPPALVPVPILAGIFNSMGLLAKADLMNSMLFIVHGDSYICLGGALTEIIQRNTGVTLEGQPATGIQNVKAHSYAMIFYGLGLLANKRVIIRNNITEKFLRPSLSFLESRCSQAVLGDTTYRRDSGDITEALRQGVSNLYASGLYGRSETEVIVQMHWYDVKVSPVSLFRNPTSATPSSVVAPTLTTASVASL
ncbi:MAG: hypothetical protein WCW01_05170 [Gammaproteobacteria bacterium]